MAKPVLLTVDDDADVLSAIARDLRKQYGRAYRILRADSGSAALTLLRELKDRGDPVALLLSDQRMPKMDGVTLLSEAIKSHPKSKRVLLTAYADTEAAMGAINKSQVDYYLLKPWDPPEERLYPVLDDLLDDGRASFRPGYGGVRVVGDCWSARCHRVRDFLARNQVPYRFLDVESSDEARALAADVEPSGLPLVILPSGADSPRRSLPTLPNRLGSGRRPRSAFTTWRSLGRAPPGWRPPCTGDRRGCERSLSSGKRRAVRPAPAARSRTTWGSPRDCRAAISRAAR